MRPENGIAPGAAPLPGALPGPFGSAAETADTREGPVATVRSRSSEECSARGIRPESPAGPSWRARRQRLNGCCAANLDADPNVKKLGVWLLGMRALMLAWNFA